MNMTAMNPAQVEAIAQADAFTTNTGLPSYTELAGVISVTAAQLRAAGEGSIALAFRLSDQACYDIMCTASEGGINYWADIVRRKGQTRPDSHIGDIVMFEAEVEDGPVSCDHPEIEAQEIGRFTIDPDMIRAGLRRLLAPGAEISPTIRNDAMLQLVDPEHASDADTADAIVQFAVFGELVFG